MTLPNIEALPEILKSKCEEGIEKLKTLEIASTAYSTCLANISVSMNLLTSLLQKEVKNNNGTFN